MFVLSHIIKILFPACPSFIYNRLIKSVFFISLLITYECYIIVIFNKTLEFNRPVFQLVKFLSIIFHPYSMYFYLYMEKGFNVTIEGVFSRS